MGRLGHSSSFLLLRFISSLWLGIFQSLSSLGFSWLPLVVLLGAAAGQEVSSGGAQPEPQPPSSGGATSKPQPSVRSGGATPEPQPPLTRPCYCLGDQGYSGYVCPLGTPLGSYYLSHRSWSLWTIGDDLCRPLCACCATLSTLATMWSRPPDA